MDFCQIQKFHKNPPTIQLKRTPYMEKKYQNSKRTTENYEKNLYHRVFPDPNLDWSILPNEFPYHFTDKTKHYIIWYKGDILSSYFESALDSMGAVYFENLDSNKSIKSIRHIHVFINNLE